MTIPLINLKQSFIDLYYVNGQGKFFTYPPTRNSAIAVAISLVICVFIYRAAVIDEHFPGFFIVLAVLAVIFAASRFARNAIAYQKWKKSISIYLKELEKSQNYSLVLEAGHFEFVSDSNTEIIRWSHIKKATVTPNAVFLLDDSGERHVFPAACMQPAEFEELKKYIREGMKKSATIEES